MDYVIIAIIVAGAVYLLGVYLLGGRITSLQAEKAEVESHLNAERQRYRDLRADVRETIEKERSARTLAWPKPAHRMPERDVVGEFDVPIDEPWFVAVHQELDDAIADALDEVTQAPSATLTTERRTHTAGGAEFLREFQKRLLELQHKAAHTDDDLTDDEKKTD